MIPEAALGYNPRTMRTAVVRAAFAAAALLVVPALAAAAPKTFTGPSGWDHTVGATPSASSPRAQETWKKNDGELLTYLADGGLAYDDIVGMVKKNITDNAVKAPVDRDTTCDGHRAHEVEMTFGTSVVHQVIIDEAPGVAKLTYTRPQGAPVAPDVATDLSGYCGWSH
ncbi:hypothetical protein WPS_22600 [Vulcanimicrobium alpinum]|uniref:Uncharacterized protein n=1 Tax=Vulcanimicrobium alpinum TaxID=3016050 RepID=A0AAN1XXX8_UNVUL|nr:hypothetical protein [Vulcanimicrobium alpinum]BDE06984.1 hypothetical protein WPS_22600 [Vulcanimicrobium alpinum]